jgi:hypothetical protein
LSACGIIRVKNIKREDGRMDNIFVEELRNKFPSDCFPNSMGI